MKKTLWTLALLIACLDYAEGTIYTYISPNGVSTYTTPTETNPTPATGVQLTGQLAGALTAASAARTTGNPAAIMGTQNALINTGANAVSAAIMGAIGPMVHAP